MNTECKWVRMALVVWVFLLTRDLQAQESAFSAGNTAAPADTAVVVPAGGVSVSVQKVNAEIYCPIVSFEPQEDGTLLATIARGRDDGLVGGTRGEVYSRRDKETDRKAVIAIGQAELVGMEADSAIVRIHPTHEDTLYAIAVGDVVVLSARIPRLKYPTVLFHLAQQAISFTGTRNKPFFQYRDFIEDPEKDFETELLPLMAREAARFAFAVYKVEKGKTPAETGRFTGLTAREAMKQTTADDVRAFLHFADYYVGAYIGNPSRFAKEYMKWVLSQAPVSPGEVNERAFGIEDRNQRKAYLRSIAELFEDDYIFEEKLDNYIERWYSDVLRLSAAAEFEKAHQLVDLMLLAADVVDRPPTYSLAYSAYGWLLYDEKRYQEAIDAYTQAMNYAVREEDRINQAKYQNNIANAYKALERYETALEFYQESLKNKKKVKTQDSYESQAHTYTGLGDVYVRLSRYGKALKAYQAAREIYQSRHDLTGQENEAAVLAEVGRILNKQGKYREAIEAWESSRAIRENLGYRASVAKSLADISSGYWSLGEYQQAIDYRQRAFDLYQEVGDTRSTALALTDLGSLNWITGDYEKAIEYYRTALAIHGEDQDRGDEADVLKRMGSLERERGDFPLSLEYLQASLATREELGKKADIAEVAYEIAQTLNARKTYDEASPYFERALALYQEVGDRAAQAQVMEYWGTNYYEQKQIDRALELYEEGLAIRQEIGDKSGVCDSMRRLGYFYYGFKNDYGRARPFAEKSLELAHELPSKPQEAAALALLASIYDSQGKLDKAFDTYDEALRIYEKIEDQAGIAETNNRLGNMHQIWGDYGEALDYYQRAVEIARAADNQLTVLDAFVEIGRIYDKQGRYEEAKSILEEALEIIQTLDYDLGQSNVYDGLAGIYTDLGDFQKALEYHEQAFAIRKGWNHPFGMAASSNNIGRVYLEQRDYEKATEYFTRSLEIGRKIDDFELVMVPTANLAEVYTFTGEYERAIELLREAVDIAEDKKSEPRLVEFNELLGKIHRLQGRHGDAEKRLKKAIGKAKKLGLTVSVASIQNELGIVAYERQDYKRAQKRLSKASDSARRLRLPGALWEPLYYLGLTYRERGDNEKAIAALQEAVAALEQMRSKVVGGESAESLFQADKLQVYETLVDLLSRAGRGEEAFQYAGLMKSQELSSIVTRGQADFSDDPEQQELYDQARSFRGREFELVRLLKEEQLKSRNEQRQELVERWQNELDQVKLEFGDFRRQLEKDHSEIYRSLQIEPADLQRLQRNLRTDEVFIEPVILPDRIVTFVVRGGVGRDDLMLPPLIHRQIEVTQERVDGLLRQMRHGLENAGVDWSGARAHLAGQRHEPRNEDPTRASQALYALLIEPLHSLLDSATTLIVSPSGRLRYIPFQALHDGEHYLVEKFRVAVVTRVGAFKEHQEVDIAQTGILAMANPDGSLAAAEEEVKEIRKIWRPFEAYYGPEATKENLRQNARYYPIIHLATHGVLRNDRPQESFLLMAGEPGHSRLTFREIPLLPLWGTYLATLSACQTALGDKGEGSEISGLAYEFEQQGAATVVASLWAVNDVSTADFMIEFYSQLRKPEVSKAEALQAAQLKLLSAPETQHPYFWAPFILIGDWRK